MRFRDFSQSRPFLIEEKREGLVLGLAVKMFTIAGPVLVYGTVASVIYGIIYWICSLF